MVYTLQIVALVFFCGIQLYFDKISAYNFFDIIIRGGCLFYLYTDHQSFDWARLLQEVR